MIGRVLNVVIGIFIGLCVYFAGFHVVKDLEGGETLYYIVGCFSGMVVFCISLWIGVLVEKLETRANEQAEEE
jgi:hypothetical protein